MTKTRLFKEGDKVDISGDISNSDYNVRVSSSGVVDADQSTANSKVWVTIDEIDGDRNVSMRVSPKMLTLVESKSEANLDDLKGMVVSEGTMRSEDLIPKFLNVLKTYGKDKYDAYVKENPEVLDLEGMDDETMGWVVDELFDKLDEIAPEGFYFATHPDDGACYGFWEVEPDESKKPEACKGDKKDDKKDGKAAESKKSEGVIGIGGTMYASKLKSLARKLGSFGFKVSDNVEVKDENANDKSAEYNLSAEKDGKSYKINVDIYEGKHTTITLRDGATNAYISHLGEGSSFASAVSVIDADSVKSESKKSEGIGDHIKMNIDYNTFMRLLDAAAYLEADDDYKDALWEYFSEFGELDGDACEFFDNLFQYTDWYTAEDVWDNYDNILGTKPEDKDAEEALDAYLEEHGDDLGGASVYKHGDHYLILQ